MKSSFLVAGGAVGGSLSLSRAAHAYGSDLIRVGLVGCGAQGTRAAIHALQDRGGEVHLTAMADVFADRIHSSYRSIRGKHRKRVDVPKDRRFTGLDAYSQLLETDVDLVILATPPSFRPLHFEAAVEAGRHVFMEPPLAVDAPGVRRIVQANQTAGEDGLTVAIGLHRRHQPAYRETVSKLREGAIGEIVLARAYWNTGRARSRARVGGQTELEHQLRNWHHFNWLSGDHVVERHIQNLDVINWAIDGHPVHAQGQGGRVRTSEGVQQQCFDHHFVEFTYADGPKLLSQCRRVDGCWNCVAEHVHGTRGRADVSGGKIYDRVGDLVWRTKAGHDGPQRQFQALFAALRRGELVNEVAYGVQSTMTAILGRMACDSGQPISWEEALESDHALADPGGLAFADNPAPLPAAEATIG